MVPIEQRIIAVLNRYIGQTEKTGNAGFNDPLFEARMKLVGWKKGEAWCAYTAELIWKEAYLDKNIEKALKEGSISDPMYRQLDRLFAPSALGTWANFKGSAEWKTGKEPKVGALAIWQLGNGWQGHVGIVKEPTIDKKAFYSGEGNGSKAGSREGTTIVVKKRLVDFTPRITALNLLGFVYPRP